MALWLFSSKTGLFILTKFLFDKLIEDRLVFFSIKMVFCFKWSNQQFCLIHPIVSCFSLYSFVMIFCYEFSCCEAPRRLLIGHAPEINEQISKI